ncbi:MAG: hypothetical protein OHK0039_09810 [Bacteroidia bacterium]
MRMLIKTLQTTLTIWLCLLLAGGIYAQPTGLGALDPLGNRGSADGFAGPGAGLQSDSLGQDSAAVRGKIDIKPDTRWVNRSRLFAHEDPQERFDVDFASLMYWDELDLVPGYVQTLGQIGKYHRVWYHGLDERWFRRDLWWDPIMGRYNRYVVGAETQVRYFDTHTPYVNIDYALGPEKLAALDVTLSQNLSPQLNLTAYLKRRQAVGVYRNHTTDHYGLYLSGYYRSRSDRYHLFSNVTYNTLADEVNGGVPRSGDFAVVDGLIQDNVTAYNNSFFKGGSAPVLDAAQSRHRLLAGYADQYYHLLGTGDSGTVGNRLTLRVHSLVEQDAYRFVDRSIALSRLAANAVPVYPALATDSTDILEGYTATRANLASEASYSLELGRIFSLNLQGGLAYGRIGLRKDTLVTAQNYTDQYVRARLRVLDLEAEADLRQRVSDRFAPDRTLHLAGHWAALGRRAGYRLSADSQPDLARTRAPLTLGAVYDFREMNPSLFQGYYPGDSGYAFRPDPTLQNQLMNHLAVDLRLDLASPIRRADTLLPMYVTAGVFATRINRLVYYDSTLRSRQVPAGQAMQWVGASLAFRLRFLRHFYLEADQTASLGTGSTDDAAAALYLRQIPALAGHAALYYDQRWIKIAEGLRIGIEGWYQTSYAGQTVDPVSGEFFPTRYRVPGYVRIDAYAVLRLRGVYLFGRIVHANEGLLLAGYYTTPFYPMLERTATLGVNWTFYR